MNWNQSRTGYYLDFFLIPLMMLVALASDGASFDGFAVMPVGMFVWSFIEYWIHRSLFHRVLRRAHWLHHQKPGGYVAAPAWLTLLLHLFVLTACLMSLGPRFGNGFFVGLEIGYLSYIVTHDLIHHRKQKPFGWLRRRWEHHNLHHQGIEVNFGVATHFWDRVFKTYRDPRQGGQFAARPFSG